MSVSDDSGGFDSGDDERVMMVMIYDVRDTYESMRDCMKGLHERSECIYDSWERNERVGSTASRKWEGGLLCVLACIGNLSRIGT